MSKESIIRKRLEKTEKERESVPPPPKSPSTPVLVPVLRRSSRRRLNRKFIITFAIWLIALIAALYFLTR